MNAGIIAMCLGINFGPLFADLSTKMDECLNHHRNGSDNVLSEHAQITAHSSHTMNSVCESLSLMIVLFHFPVTFLVNNSQSIAHFHTKFLTKFLFLVSSFPCAMIDREGTGEVVC